MELARDQLAAKEMDIGRFNQKDKNFTGAINRFKVVVTQYRRLPVMSRRRCSGSPNAT